MDLGFYFILAEDTNSEMYLFGLIKLISCDDFYPNDLRLTEYFFRIHDPSDLAMLVIVALFVWIGK